MTLSPLPAAIRKCLARGIKFGDLIGWCGPGDFVYHDGGRRLHHIVTANDHYTAEQAFQIAALSEMGLEKIVYVGEAEWEEHPTPDTIMLLDMWRADAP